jgi:pimeloyl-ACP methyl ester carboxylesterase
MQPGVERVRVPWGGHEVVADVHLRDEAGPPVLFLHGILTSTAVVRDLFDDPDRASWISVSLPGHQPGRQFQYRGKRHFGGHRVIGGGVH